MPGGTTYDAYVEQRPDGNVLAQILDLPGCYGAGRTEDDALQALAECIGPYLEWLRQHDDYTPLVARPYDLHVKERAAPGDVLAADANPLPDEDLDWHRTLLDWSFTDLAAYVSGDSVGGGPAAQRVIQGVQRTQRILACIDHPETQPPGVASHDPASLIQRAQDAWDVTIARMRTQQPDERVRRFECEGEWWTPRKVLRRGIQSLRETAAAL